MPHDMREVLTADVALVKRYNDLAPLARNEWICWVTSVKKEGTRAKHLVQLTKNLHKGKRRPCCVASCPHHL